MSGRARSLTNAPRARRTAAARAEPPPDLVGADYLDAFELLGLPADSKPPEVVARLALEQASWATRTAIRAAHRFALALRLQAAGAPGHLLGWRVTESSDDRVVLRADSPLLSATLLLRRRAAGSMQLLTALTYARPRVARPLWRVVGPAHRWIAPRLLERAASR